MAATPTTKSQVQAYRFVLRRMEHALVRKDAVMLHDPMRTQVRATAVGIVLGILGLAGFALFSVFRPSPTIDQDLILVSKTSTQTFVVVPNADGTRILHPVYNLASARLIVGQAAVASQVDDKALATLPRGPELGIVGGPDVLPAEADRPSATWTVCDEVRGDLGSATTAPTLSTTVLAGDLSGGADELSDGQALYVSGPDGSTQLVYTSEAGVVRADVDPKDTAIARALDLSGVHARPASEGLLNAIPEVAGLTVPSVPGAGAEPTYGGPRFPTGLVVGDVLTEQDEGMTNSYVLLSGGIQKVSGVVARLLQTSSGNATEVGPDQLVGVGDSSAPLDLSGYPREVPTVLPTADGRVGCLSWDGTSATTGEDAASFQPTLRLLAGARLPVPDGARTVPLAGADDDGGTGSTGFHLDAYYVQPGKGAVVQVLGAGGTVGVGTRYLVGDTGTRYGIPDAETAGVLGLGTVTSPAPESVVALLPQGPELSEANARQSHNGVAADPAAEPFAAPTGG